MNTNEISVQEQVKSIVISHLEDYQQDKIKITSLTGLTNETFKVTCEGKPSLIFRKFGGHFNRNIENQIFKTLQQSNIAPKCYYACSDYRIQQFIENAVHPTINELKDDNLKKKILKALCIYHKNQIGILKNKPLFIQEALFSKKYFQKIKAQKNKSLENIFQQLYTLVEAQYQKIDQLKLQFFEQNPEQAKKKIKFCHNDLNNLNIFTRPQIIIIDYQYSCYNYLYYDIANFLNQCNINYKIKQFPYFKIEKKMNLDEIQRLSKLYPQSYPNLQKDIIKGLVACNLYWAAWSIIMAYDPSQGEFGTVEHGLARMSLYNHYKKFI